MVFAVFMPTSQGFNLDHVRSNLLKLDGLDRQCNEINWLHMVPCKNRAVRDQK